jgi:phospholipid/cholesterol/gamma-HCH transport system substrate-binding protein
MLLRSTIVKLIAFGVIAVLGIAYTWYAYGGGNTVIPGSVYTVKLHLKRGGGIFPNAGVTYRGVKVGTVSAMRLTDTGIVVDLDIKSSSAPIPANVQADVRDLSPIGEQYVDLKPQSKGGPTLGDLPPKKRVIDPRHATTPPPVQNLINQVDSLANSVPEQSLRTVVDELHTGLAGTGGDLQQLLDSANSFTTEAQQHLPQTVRLLDASRTVLDTQNDLSGQLRSFSTSLEKLAAQLKSSDPDLRHVIDSGPGAALAVDRVLRESGQGLSVVLANLLTTTEVVKPRNDGLRLLLVTYPLVTPATQSVLHGNGEAHLGLALNLFNPPPCVRGYQGTNRRPGNVTQDQQPNYQAYCAEPPGSPIDVRGSQNAPYKGVPETVPPGGSGGATPGGGGAPATGSGGSLSMAALGPSALSGLLGLPKLG